MIGFEHCGQPLGLDLDRCEWECAVCHGIWSGREAFRKWKVLR